MGFIFLFFAGNNFSKSFLILEIFFLISFCFKIFLVESLPDGSPINVVPPPKTL